MASGARQRRAAKQRRRDERRGFTPGDGAAGAGGAAGAAPAHDRGLPAETLRRLLRDTATDVAAGHEQALGQLRRLLAEHLARRRTEILAACDDVLAEAGLADRAPRDTATEDAVVATVRRLSGLT